MFEYIPMCPPAPIKPFEDMTQKEARAHFDWYVAEIPARLQMLRDAYEAWEGGRRDELDLSPESLKKLWTWFVPQVELSPEERLTVETLYIMSDIALYFATVLITRHEPKLHWMLVEKPKRDMSYHEPVVQGFKTMFLNPRRVAHVLTLKVALDGRDDPNALYNTYLVWSEDVP